jgi:hypothetical protein
MSTGAGQASEARRLAFPSMMAGKVSGGDFEDADGDRFDRESLDDCEAQTCPAR